MKINIDEYRVNKQSILRAYELGGLERALLLASTSMIPIIAALYYIREEVGPDKRIDRNIKEVIDFYKYDEIEGILESGDE